MTCIVAIVEDSKVYLGGDSIGISGYSKTQRKDPKVFKNGEYVMGFTSSFRMGQLLAYSFKPPKPSRKDEKDLQRFMSTKFIDSVRKCLKIGGYTKFESSRESGGCFFVGYKNRLFVIDYDFQVGESLDTFDSIGCGADLALGALDILYPMDMGPLEKLHKALSSATKFSAGVSGPYSFVNT